MNNKCPECESPAVTMCRCFRGDSECEKGHRWHTCIVHKVKVSGHSDHSNNVGWKNCTCGGAKVYSEQLKFEL